MFNFLDQCSTIATPGSGIPYCQAADFTEIFSKNLERGASGQVVSFADDRERANVLGQFVE